MMMMWGFMSSDVGLTIWFWRLAELALTGTGPCTVRLCSACRAEGTGGAVCARKEYSPRSHVADCAFFVRDWVHRWAVCFRLWYWTEPCDLYLVHEPCARFPFWRLTVYTFSFRDSETAYYGWRNRWRDGGEGGGGIYPAYVMLVSKVKTCALGPPRPLSPTVPTVAGRQLVRAAASVCTWLFLAQCRSGESLHCFLVGVIKILLQQPLTCDSSSMFPICFPHSPPRSPTTAGKQAKSQQKRRRK